MFICFLAGNVPWLDPPLLLQPYDCGVADPPWVFAKVLYEFLRLFHSRLFVPPILRFGLYPWLDIYFCARLAASQILTSVSFPVPMTRYIFLCTFCCLTVGFCTIMAYHGHGCFLAYQGRWLGCWRMVMVFSCTVFYSNQCYFWIRPIISKPIFTKTTVELITTSFWSDWKTNCIWVLHTVLHLYK